MDRIIRDSLMAIVDIKAKFKKDKEHKSSIKCVCGGTIHYVVAEINKHVWAKCDTCKIAFIE